jgi:hypothetical protein
MVDLSSLEVEELIAESYILEYNTKVGSLFIDLQDIQHNLFFCREDSSASI